MEIIGIFSTLRGKSTKPLQDLNPGPTLSVFIALQTEPPIYKKSTVWKQIFFGDNVSDFWPPVFEPGPLWYSQGEIIQPIQGLNPWPPASDVTSPPTAPPQEKNILENLATSPISAGRDWNSGRCGTPWGKIISPIHGLYLLPPESLHTTLPTAQPMHK